jgi:Xanthine and CO dehydrogenases maturation factor, XdhC/CoxF family
MALVANYLAEEGFDKVKVDAIRSPAGIDINAKSPDEIAICILAEIIQVQRTPYQCPFHLKNWINRKMKQEQHQNITSTPFAEFR